MITTTMNITLSKETDNVASAFSKMPVIENIINGGKRKEKRIKILHLEDVRSDAALVNNKLKKSKLHYEILVVDTKDKFITELKDFSPDIILADHSLPSFNSDQALTTLYETGFKIPFILVTATMSDELAVGLIRKGADDYILKDRLGRLPAAIQNVLEKYGMQRAKETIIDELISSQLHLKEAQAVAKVGSWETDLQTFDVKWSEETHHIFETDPKKFQATHEAFLSFLHPDDRNKVNTAFENSFDSQTLNSVEHRIISADGRLKHVIENWKVFHDGQGYPVRATGTCQDITERKLTEIDLLESREEMQTVFNASLDAIIIIDEEGKITKWDSKSELLFGWKEEEAIGTLLSDKIIPPGLRERYKQGMKHFLKTGEGIILNKTIEVKAFKKDKTEISISLSISPTRVKNKYQFIGFIRDISARKVVEEALQTSESNLQAIFENTSDGFILVDVNGIIKSFNTKARDRIRLNIEQEIIIGKSIFDFLPDSRKERYKENISKVLSGEILQYDYPYTRKSGEIKWFSFTINPVYNAGKIEGIAFTSTDITERKKAEEQLRESEAFNKGILASLSSHIAVIDHRGNIIAVNKVWDDFANANGVNSLRGVSTGSNYIEVCQRSMASGDILAGQTLQGIQSVFNKEIKNFELEYPCHSLTEQRWFNLSVMNFGEDDSKVVISHQNITARKIAEEKLKATSEELRTTSERLLLATTSAKMGIWDWDIANDVMAWDNRMYQLYGIGEQHFTGAVSVWQNGVHPDDIERAGKESNDAINGIGDFDTEFRVVWPDKSVHFIEAHAIVSRNEAGVGVRMIGVNIDITERKAAEEKVIKLNEEVAKSEKFFKGVIESSDDMITILDPCGKTIYASPAVAKKFGYSMEECLNLNISDVVHPDDALVMQEFIMKLLMNPEVPLECPLIRERKKDGTYMWVEGTLTNFLETEGINAIVANFRDVTERKKADEENRFKANLLNTIGQAAIATDINGVINYWNQAAENIYGWTKEEALGQYVVDLTTSDGANEQAVQIMEEVKKGKTWSGEFKVRKKDGTNFPALVTNSPIYDEDNRLSGIIGISSDITEMKKLEGLLETSNRMARIGSWEYNIITQAHYWSPITREIFEVNDDLTPDLQTSIKNYKSGASRSSISNAVDRAIKDGTPWDLELQIVTAKGNELWVRDIGKAEFINGNCIRLYGSFQDIDTRKKAELEVLNVYEEKNIILESIDDGFFAVDTNWIVTYWNNQSEKMLCRSTDEMIGKNLWEVYSHDIGSPFYIYFNKAINENAVQHFESYSETLETWYELSAYPSVNGLSVYFKDIKERKLAEQQIKADKNLLRTLIDHLPDTIYYKDKSAKKQISNKFDYYTVLGADTEQEVLGKTDMEISSHPNALMTYAHDMEILRTGNPLINFEEYFTTANNKPLWLLTSKLPLRNEDNEIIGLLGIGRDITQRKIAEEKLLEVNSALEKNIKQLEISNAELEQFAFVASHDLQEPLRMVTSFLTLLEKKYGNSIDDKGKQYIHFAVDGAKRMRQIMLDLLEFSRIGRVEDKTEEVNLNELVDGIIRLHSKKINETNAVLNIAKLPVLNISREPMRQVFQNLISNSLKYHTDGVAPQISISVNSAGKFWQFAVSDNGIGIGEAYLDKIFIIFQRLHNKEKYTGTGIGLAITKKIIESMGGNIRVESEEGKGSTFHFTLPKGFE